MEYEIGGSANTGIRYELQEGIGRTGRILDITGESVGERK
jgi:hypothetical protein